MDSRYNPAVWEQSEQLEAHRRVAAAADPRPVERTKEKQIVFSNKQKVDTRNRLNLPHKSEEEVHTV